MQSENQESLSNIYETISFIYSKNITFLEKEYPEIYEKISVLTTTIDNGQYQANYDLEFVNGYFDIKDINKNSYIYNKNSYEVSDNIILKVDKTKNDTTALLSIDYDLNKLAKNRMVKDFWPIIDCINEDVDFSNYEFTKIYKYMFIGTGLGIHIDYINRQFNPNSLLIVEPDIEIFNLSLFITDYSSLKTQTNRLYFSIADSRINVLKKANDFLGHQPYLNYSIKHSLFTQSYTNILSEIAAKMMNSHSSLFSYKIQLQSFNTTLRYMKKKYKFPSIRGLMKSKRLTKYPTLILSAGPSVSKNIQWLKNNQKKFYVIAVNTILTTLEKHNIRPDIIVAIDPGNEVYFENLKNIKNKKFIEGIPLVGPSQLAEKTVKYFKKKQVFLFQVYTIDTQLGTFLSSANVGTYAMNLAVLLGSKSIYTLGNDCAMDSETGRIYAKDTTDRKIDIDAKKYEKSKDIMQYGDLLEVAGNLREKVYTNRRLFSFKDDHEKVIEYLTKDFKVSFYNLSDGALIEGMEPIEISQLDDLKTLRKYNLSSYFDKHTLKLKLPNFEDDLKALNKMISKLQKFKKVKIKNRDDLLNKQLQILTDFLDICKEMAISSFGYIFLEFLELSGLYFYFYLNVKGDHLSDNKKLNHLKLKWTQPLIEVISDMKQEIKEKKK